MILVKDALSYSDITLEKINSRIAILDEAYKSAEEEFEFDKNRNWFIKFLYSKFEFDCGTKFWIELYDMESIKKKFTNLNKRMKYLHSIGELTTDAFRFDEPSQSSFYAWVCTENLHKCSEPVIIDPSTQEPK